MLNLKRGQFHGLYLSEGVSEDIEQGSQAILPQVKSLTSKASLSLPNLLMALIWSNIPIWPSSCKEQEPWALYPNSRQVSPWQFQSGQSPAIPRLRWTETTFLPYHLPHKTHPHPFSRGTPQRQVHQSDHKWSQAHQISQIDHKFNLFIPCTKVLHRFPR